MEMLLVDSGPEKRGMTGILHQKSNITLVGMPGAGKSTIGVILAKFFSFGFMDMALAQILWETWRGAK